jgi:DNA-binding MarR family transcriptional regulator
MCYTQHMTRSRQEPFTPDAMPPDSTVPTATPVSTALLAELLTRASWRLRKNERGALEPYGLTFAQARALRLLAQRGTMRMGDLAENLEIVPRSATTRVDELETAGLAARRADPADRRSILVEISARGRELVARLQAERQAGAESLFAPLGSSDRLELARLLQIMGAVPQPEGSRSGEAGEALP